jgi:hypothetical protein
MDVSRFRGRVEEEILKIWPWRSKKSEAERDLNELRAAAGKTPSELPLEDLFPIFVPASFSSSGGLIGPYTTDMQDA